MVGAGVWPRATSARGDSSLIASATMPASSTGPLRGPCTPTPVWRGALLGALILAGGCTSYEAEPLEPLEILRALERVQLAEVTSAEVTPVVSSFALGDGLSVLEASAVAVRRNPRLLALRAELGVAEAQLVQAGLLADPVIGWGSGDPLADLILEGQVESTSWLTGASLSWQVPRPGEIGAREGVARARIHARAAELAGAEWTLVRDVHLAYARLLVARARRAQTERLLEIAGRARDYFARAKQAGAATALDEALARVAAATVQADAIGARNAEVLAAQALNALLGLSPGVALELQDSVARLTAAAAPVDEPSDLVAASLDRRPDLQQVLADYRQADETLRLQCALQWPQLSIGTGVSIQLPIFSRLNQPAIETATRRRDAARRRATAAVQATRAEVHAALARARQAHAVFALFRDRLGPQAEETLRLTERAFQAREVTPLQILTAQRQVLETQTRFLAAQEAWAAARIRLDSACGRLLPSARTPLPPSAEADPQEAR